MTRTLYRNCFAETMLGLEYSADSDADLFSQACVEGYRFAPSDGFGYPFTQIFEPDVLREVALLEGIPYEDVAELRHRPTEPIRELAGFVDASGDLTVVELVRLASSLVSISRFAVAARVVALARGRATAGRERFELAWLSFLVSNRRDDGSGSPIAFASMRTEIDYGGVPSSRVLDVCTQAVVWFVKRRELPAECFAWAVRTGTALAGGGQPIDIGSLSSWYRGIAMVPAARAAVRSTQRYMRLAERAAQRSVDTSPGALSMNAIKTYHESTLKEHVYVTNDFGAAWAAGQTLIDLDPAWSPSYGELAAACVGFGRLEQAAGLYTQAVRSGPPYVGLHLIGAARARCALGDHETAVSHYGALLSLDRRNPAVREEGRACAKHTGTAAPAEFDTSIADHRLGP
jgi:hypothetical protein